MAYTVDDMLADPAEDHLSLISLAREKSVAPPTAWRWAMKGVRGLRLPSYMRGSARMTTRPAYCWWVAELTARADQQCGAVRAAATTPSRAKQIDAAERELEKLGI